MCRSVLGASVLLEAGFTVVFQDFQKGLRSFRVVATEC